MSSFSRTQLFVACLFFALLSQVIGHSYVTSPVSRSFQRQSNAGCRGPICFGPCDAPKNRIVQSRVQTATRGQTIRVEWPRNNHAAGFIRFAWASTSDSDNHAAFDAHVQQINCHEVGGCRSSSSDLNGGDDGPADGSRNPCAISITVPLDLADGQWTLQWAWFGGAFALGDYYSCVDYVISGGPTGDTLAPRFVGGDVSNPNQQVCKYFNVDRLHRCVNEPCDNPVIRLYSSANGAPYGFSSNGGSSTSTTGVASTSSSTSTTGLASTSSSSSTTGRASTSSTSTSTTGRASTSSSSSTTGLASTSSSSTSTTGSSRPSSTSTTGAPSTPSTGSNAVNCAGATVVTNARATITSVETWTNQFHANIVIDQIDATLTDWIVEVNWNAPNHVGSVFGGGALQCEGPQTSYFRPSAQWANNVLVGSSMGFDIIATNANGLDMAGILASAQLRVLKM